LAEGGRYWIHDLCAVVAVAAVFVVGAVVNGAGAAANTGVQRWFPVLPWARPCYALSAGMSKRNPLTRQIAGMLRGVAASLDASACC
jgi:hypothetical protein